MAGVKEVPKPLTSLQIEVPNDLQEQEEGALEDSEDAPMEEDDELEEGEASADEVEVNIIIPEESGPNTGRPQRSSSPTSPLDHMRSNWPENRYERIGGFVSGICEVSDKVLSERARRFGVTEPPKYATTPAAIDKLLKSLDITHEDFERGRFRPDALFMRGVEGLSTNAIFDYFQAYAPANVDWLNDKSCIVEWQDSAGPFRALIGLSCPIIPRPVDLKKSKHKQSLKNKKIQDSSSDSEDEESPKSKKKKKKKEKPQKEKPQNKEKEDSSSSSSNSSSSDSDSSSSSSSSNSSSSGSSTSSSSSSSSSSSDSESEDGKEKVKKKKKKAKVKVEKMEEDGKPQDNKEEGSVHTDDVAIPVPPGRWRLGVPCPRTKAVLLRFASYKDRKDEIPERNISYRIGMPGFGIGARARISESGRRKMLDAQKRRAREENRWRNRMMDDGSKNPWGELAQNWGRKESQEDDRFDYQELLRQHQKRAASALKRKRYYSEDEEEVEVEYGSYDDYESSEEDSSEDSDDVVQWKSKIKIPRMKMYADAEQKKKRRRSSRDLKNRLSGRNRPSGRSMRSTRDIQERKRIQQRTVGGIQERLTNIRRATSTGSDNGRVKKRLDLRSRLSGRKTDAMPIELDSARYYSIIASDDD